MKNVLVDFQIFNFELIPKDLMYVYQVIKRFFRPIVKILNIFKFYFVCNVCIQNYAKKIRLTRSVLIYSNI